MEIFRRGTDWKSSEDEACDFLSVCFMHCTAHDDSGNCRRISCAAQTKQFVTEDWADGLNLINILMGNLPSACSTLKMDEFRNLKGQLR